MFDFTTNLIIYYMYIFIAKLPKYFIIFNYEIFYKILITELGMRLVLNVFFLTAFNY